LPRPHPSIGGRRKPRKFSSCPGSGLQSMPVLQSWPENMDTVDGRTPGESLGRILVEDPNCEAKWEAALPNVLACWSMREGPDSHTKDRNPEDKDGYHGSSPRKPFPRRHPSRP
jgi:hypothetical protein